MQHQLFDAMTRRAGASVSRRGSLATLGGAALAAALGGTLPAAAKKGNKKGKSNGKTQCKKQVDPCQEQLAVHCEDDRGPCDALLACCEPLADCKAKQAMDCMFAYFALEA